MNVRNLNLDLMRLIGVLIIMIAHSSPPEWLFQLRNFGTPLLIIASALTYSFIYSRKEIKPYLFYKKRLIRLILPAWIFLSFFFLVSFTATNSINLNYPFTIEDIINSYLFMGGIGFVWILKVYIILALITPIVIKLSRKTGSNNRYFLTLALSYLIYELSIYIISPSLNGDIEKLFNEVIFIFFGYSLLYFYGFRLSKLTNKSLYIITLTFFSIFTILAFIKFIKFDHFIGTQGFKYPPTLYYLSYALFSTNIIYLIIRKIDLSNDTTSQIIIWLSSNSLWIYLWHIMGYYIWSFTLEDPNGNFFLFLLKTIFLLLFGILVTFLQHKFVDKFISKNNIFGREISKLLT